MNDVSPQAVALDDAGAGLNEVVAEFADELGGPPTLAEFLELVGWAMPMHSDATDGTFAEPTAFKATLKGNKSYRGDAPSRVPDLDDHLFEDARDVLRVLAEYLNAADGAPVTPQRLASAMLEVLRAGRIILADVEPEDIRKLTADVPKKRIAAPKPGDVLAIPAKGGGYHPAVVLAKNRFGMALGLFHGTSAQGRPNTALREAPRKLPVYTADNLVKDGTWKVVDHDDSLRQLFPADPPIYHRPNAWQSVGIDTGTHGAAETADGTMRFIQPDEAREVGLEDGTYLAIHLAVNVQQQLDIDAGRA